jgi:hypothetical protein
MEFLLANLGNLQCDKILIDGKQAAIVIAWNPIEKSSFE